MSGRHRAPRPEIGWPFGAVLATGAAAAAVVATVGWRAGLFVLVADLILAASLRAVLPSHRAGLLVVRGRRTDVALAALLAAGLLTVTVLTRSAHP